MMFFSATPGQVVAIPDAGFPIALKISNWRSSMIMRAAITKLGISASANAQFMQTLRNYLYVYVFGDRPGEVLLSGVGFSSSPDCSDSSYSGLDAVWSFYQRNKISACGMPVFIAIGVLINLRASLIKLDMSPDPSSGLTSWSMHLVYHDRENTEDGKFIQDRTDGDGTDEVDEGDDGIGGGDFDFETDGDVGGGDF